MSDREDMKDNYTELEGVLRNVETIKKEWQDTMDSVEHMVILTDLEDRIRRCNRAFSDFIRLAYGDIIGKGFNALLSDKGILLDKQGHSSNNNAMYFKHLDKHYKVSIYLYKDSARKEITGTVIIISDITELNRLAQSLEIKNQELEKSHEEIKNAYTELSLAQGKILQREKMAAIGQLAAGIAHEINNPMGFISSNLGTLRRYIEKFTELQKAQAEAVEELSSIINDNRASVVVKRLEDTRKRLKADFIAKDVQDLIAESIDGANRVKRIVENLKGFSRLDEAEMKMADINSCIESTLNILWNELKYKAKLTKQYGNIPETNCNPGELNQVFMNILLNAVQAIQDHGEISIKTWQDKDNILVSITDTGCGIPEENLGRIFDPFFTTKPVGIGTGLGLNIAYDIINKHKGDIRVDSKIGEGTTFLIELPIVKE